MDSTLAAGIIGGSCAIAGSVVSHLLVHICDRRKDAEIRRRISLEFAVVFLEKCKTGIARDLSDADYYSLIRTLACLDPATRREVIDVYQDAKIANSTSDDLLSRASAIQARLANKLR